MSESIAQECAALDDVALVKVLTVHQSQYQADYLEAAHNELNARGLILDDIMNEVQVAFHDEDGEEVTIAQALARLDDDWPLWALRTVTNCIGDAWVIQKEHSRWLVHFYESDVYCFSFFYDTLVQLKETLKLFLSLETWDVADSHELNRWKPIFQTRSPAFLTKIVVDLDREAILHTVKTPLFMRDKKAPYVLTVPRYHLKDGEQVVAHAQAELAKLYDRAEQLAKLEDRTQELQVYDLLVQLVPENPAVHYNRGQMLLEMGRVDEGVEALGEAIVLGLPEIPEKMKLNAQRGGLGRIAGSVNPLLSLVVLAQQSSDHPKEKPIEYPDYMDDCELLLNHLLQDHPQNTAVRHCLATIAELKQNVATAKQYYEEILEIDAEDEVARSNLAYHNQADRG